MATIFPLKRKKGIEINGTTGKNSTEIYGTTGSIKLTYIITSITHHVSS